MTDKLAQVLARCKFGVHVNVNEHRNYYQTAERYLAELDQRYDEPLEIDPEVRAQMIATNIIVNLHFYPDTAGSFYEIWHHDMDAALGIALGCEGMAST